jgi:hypothetical protein
MYRYIMREQVIYGHFRDYLAIAQEALAYSKTNGWADCTLYSPLTGTGNEMVFHWDYPSLAEFERAMKAEMGDAGFTEIFRRLAAHVVQGSSRSEILMTLDDVA